MKDLYIIGAGGFGREVAWLVERINKRMYTWNLCGFIDDDVSIRGKTEDGDQVLGGCDYLKGMKNEYWAVCAVGNPTVREGNHRKNIRLWQYPFCDIDRSRCKGICKDRDRGGHDHMCWEYDYGRYKNR